MAPRKDVVIGILGLTGAGKTTFIGQAANVETAVGRSLHACTQTVSVAKYADHGGYTIHLVDTPGFDDTDRTDTEVLETIAAWLQSTHAAEALLSGIIYLHHITDNRMKGTALRNLRLFETLCGPKNMANVRLVTTMWDAVDACGTAETREQELKDQFWRGLIAMGSCVVRHDGTKESARRIVAQLLGKEPMTLQLQQELQQGKMLAQTAAAQTALAEEEARAKKQREEEMARVKAELERAEEQRVREAKERLRKQREEEEARARKQQQEAEERWRAEMAAQEAHMAHLRQREAELERQRRDECIIL